MQAVSQRSVIHYPPSWRKAVSGPTCQGESGGTQTLGVPRRMVLARSPGVYGQAGPVHEFSVQAIRWLRSVSEVLEQVTHIMQHATNYVCIKVITSLNVVYKECFYLQGTQGYVMQKIGHQ